MEKQIKFFYHFIKNLIKYNNKNWNRLQFDRDCDMRWYVRLRDWPFKKDNLEMVCGSADFLDWLIEEYKPIQHRIVTLKFKYSNKPLNIENTFECKRISKKLFKGAFYKLEGFKSKLYLCPVTLFVLGCYPKYIYIDKDYKVSGWARNNTSVSN